MKYPHIIVQLVGMNGNAFNVLGICRQAAQAKGVPAEEISAFMTEATAGDYNHLLATCQKWFNCR